VIFIGIEQGFYRKAIFPLDFYLLAGSPGPNKAHDLGYQFSDQYGFYERRQGGQFQNAG
jgi:hypothetical protein